MQTSGDPETDQRRSLEIAAEEALEEHRKCDEQTENDSDEDAEHDANEYNDEARLTDRKGMPKRDHNSSARSEQQSSSTNSDEEQAWHRTHRPEQLHPQESLRRQTSRRSHHQKKSWLCKAHQHPGSVMTPAHEPKPSK